MSQNADFEKIQKLYADRYKDPRIPDFKKVGWGSQASQVLRFKVLSEIGFQSGQSAIDVGCGLGGLLKYWSDHGLAPSRYVGVDLCEEFILDCSKRYASESNGTSTQFYTGQAADLPAQITADYVFLSGSLNLKVSDNWGLAADTLSEMFRRCSHGVAANFLSSYVDFSHEKDFHYEPEKMFSIGRKIARRVVLRHDYPLYEFSIYLLKSEVNPDANP